MDEKNIILNTDSYKVSHWLQYPPGSEYINSYIESRGGQYDYTTFFGLQMFLKAGYLNPPDDFDIWAAKDLFAMHGEPFNEEGWHKIYNLGYLPLSIQAVPEGTNVPTKNVLVQVTNTDPEFYWLPSYIETALLRGIWYPTTVATRSNYIKKRIKYFFEQTGADMSALPFRLHDFGGRGVNVWEGAGVGGCAHLVNFMGTDTLTGLIFARKYYGENMAAYSIPAAEHSTITTWKAWAEKHRNHEDGELSAFRNMLEKFPGMVAVVSDSYNIYRAVLEFWGDKLKLEVLGHGGPVIIRPDSGDPVATPIKIIEMLGEKFGVTLNQKGYKNLPPNVRVIQGDGITDKDINAILFGLMTKGWAADNIAFGMGGHLLQAVTRDTQKFAMKCSGIKFAGDKDWLPVTKSPIDQAV
jgi:nicotinamide phosphoribosyltransferase